LITPEIVVVKETLLGLEREVHGVVEQASTATAKRIHTTPGIFAIYKIRVYSCSLVVAKRWRFKLDQARQRFRLTSTERRVAVFVFAAFVLGLATKCYRDAPSPPPAAKATSSRARP
jgi:hypothetical protein